MMSKIILSIVALAYFLTLQSAYGIVMGHPMEFWDNADIILDGIVISTHTNETDKLVQHNVRVEQYFKNPKPQEMITVYGPDIYNEEWFYPKFFNEGERALFYLKKIGDKYIILEQSIAATKECSPRDMIGLSTLPGEPIGRGGPTLIFNPYQTCNGYFYSVDYLSRTLKPLKQFEAGIKIGDIRCENLVLVVKIDGSPACVKPETEAKLFERGWAKIVNIGGESSRLCSLVPDPGICKAATEKYYFDWKTNSCKPFRWGGCGGTIPFDTLEVCQLLCS